jgi:hypothetical protein
MVGYANFCILKQYIGSADQTNLPDQKLVLQRFDKVDNDNDINDDDDVNDDGKNDNFEYLDGKHSICNGYRVYIMFCHCQSAHYTQNQHF